MNHQVLILLSESYPWIKGRLHTRYSPVRRSSASIATPVTARLACVRPAASVYPEPGSNSSLYNFFLILFDVGLSFLLYYALCLLLKSFKYRTANSCQNRGAKLLTYFLITKFFWVKFLLRTLLRSFALTSKFRGAKLLTFYLTTKIFRVKYLLITFS